MTEESRVSSPERGSGTFRANEFEILPSGNTSGMREIVQRDLLPSSQLHQAKKQIVFLYSTWQMKRLRVPANCWPRAFAWDEAG